VLDVHYLTMVTNARPGTSTYDLRIHAQSPLSTMGIARCLGRLTTKGKNDVCIIGSHLTLQAHLEEGCDSVLSIQWKHGEITVNIVRTRTLIVGVAGSRQIWAYPRPHCDMKFLNPSKVRSCFPKSGDGSRWRASKPHQEEIDGLLVVGGCREPLSTSKPGGCQNLKQYSHFDLPFAMLL
jgi:hypothetical protein